MITKLPHHPKHLHFLLLLLLLFAAAALPAHAVTRFGQYTPESTFPAEFRFDDVWFIQGEKPLIPEVSHSWLTAVFDVRFMDEKLYSGESEGTYEGFINKRARELLQEELGLIDFFYDANLAEDAAFFRLRDGLTQPELKEIMNTLNADEAISYSHPVLLIEDRLYAFFNAFRITWKTGVEEASKETLLAQSAVLFDQQDGIYRVDVMKIPFFAALHLLSQDITVRETAPYLAELKPAIRASLALGMNGAHIGDTVPLTLSITFSDRVSIDPSSISTINLRPQNLQKELFESFFDPYDPTKAVLQSPLVITGRISCYAVGEFMIPPVSVSYSCPECSGETVRSVATRSVPFKVSSLVPAAQEENLLLMPASTVPLDVRSDLLKARQKRSLALTLAGFAVFVLGAAFFFLLLHRRSAGRGLVAERSPDEVLAEKLELLLQVSFPVPHWKHMGKIGTLMRDYIGTRYGIPAEHLGGSASRLMASLTGRIPDDAAGPLAEIFATVDDAVARELQHHPDSESIRRSVANLLQVTRRQNHPEVSAAP